MNVSDLSAPNQSPTHQLAAHQSPALEPASALSFPTDEKSQTSQVDKLANLSERAEVIAVGLFAAWLSTTGILWLLAERGVVQFSSWQVWMWFGLILAALWPLIRETAKSALALLWTGPWS